MRGDKRARGCEHSVVELSPADTARVAARRSPGHAELAVAQGEVQCVDSHAIGAAGVGPGAE